MDPDRQSSILAYWMYANGTDHGRAILHRPAAYSDLLQAMMLYRGVDPASKVKGATRAPIKRSSAPINVIGGNGKVTPAIELAADSYKRATMHKDWAKRTKSDPKGIEWLLSHKVN